MNEMLLSPEILERLTIWFAAGSFLMFITILSDQFFSNIRDQYVKKIERRNAGILANAIDSKIKGDLNFYQSHIEEIKHKSKSDLNEKIIRNLLEGIRHKVKGPYAEAIEGIIRELNIIPPASVAKKLIVSKSQMKPAFGFMKKTKQDGLYLNELNKYFYLNTIPGVNTAEINDKLTKWERTTLLHHLKRFYSKEQLHLDLALRSCNKSIISFSADLIRLTGSTGYLIPLISALEHLGDSNFLTETLNQVLKQFKQRDDLKVLKRYILSDSSFGTKRILMEHIKHNCIIQKDNQRWL